MKKKSIIIGVMILILVFILSACNEQQDETNRTTQEQQSGESYNQSSELLLPSDVIPVTFGSKYNVVQRQDQFIIDKLSGNYYVQLLFSYKASLQATSVQELQDCDTFERIDIKAPKDMGINISETRHISLQQRYIVSWGSYCSSVADEANYDHKLVKINAENGDVEVVDTKVDDRPLPQLIKINDTTFLSHSYYSKSSYNSKRISESQLTIYTLYGDKKQILSLEYSENSKKSEGIDLMNVVVNDDMIYGFGMQKIDSELCFFKYEYDLSGNLVSTQQMYGFNELAPKLVFSEFRMLGDYLVVKSAESEVVYICKLNGDKLEVIAKDEKTLMDFDLNERYIYFLQGGLEDDYKTKSGNHNLYIIDTLKEKTYKVDILFFPKNNTYISEIKALTNGDFMFKYYDNGYYDPQNIKHFFISKGELNALLV